MKLLLSDNHWQIEGYRQRLTEKEWKALLLEDRDIITFNGHVRRLIAESIGFGIVEIYKRPIAPQPRG